LLFATLHNQAIKVNYALGLRATQAGAVADGGPVTVSASYNAVTGTRIAGNVQPEVKAKLILDGRSVIGGEPIVLTVPGSCWPWMAKTRLSMWIGRRRCDDN